MGKMAILTLCILAVAAPARAQAPEVSWERTFGGVNNDWGWWVEEAADQGYVVAGMVYDKYGTDNEENMYVVRLAPNGNEIWSNTFGDSLMDVGTCIKPTADGGFMLLGYSNSYQEVVFYTDIRVLKLDSLGYKEWTKDYGTDPSADYAWRMCETKGGNYIIAGNSSQEGIYILKIAPDSTILNEEKIDLDVEVHDITATAEGGAMVIGGGTQLFLLKIDGVGDRDWLKGYGPTSEGWSVIQLEDGGYAAFGDKQYPLLDDDFWLLRLDAEGNVLWTRHYGNQYREKGYCVRQTLDGGFIMVGEMFPPSGTEWTQVWVVRTDASGDTLWTKTIGGFGSEHAYCVQPTADTGYIIAGRSNSTPGGDHDVYVIKLGRDGAITAGVGDDGGSRPEGFELLQNYPNPFNPATVIEFDLPRPARVSVTVFNILGQAVTRLIDEDRPAGHHRIRWDGLTSQREPAASGVYFYRIQAGDLADTRSMLLVR